MKELTLKEINFVNFSEDQYYKQETNKKQIVLHHTVSSTINGTIQSWEDDPRHISTHFIIDRNGKVYQLYNTKYWSYHLGVDNKKLEQESIGIELINWGWLQKKTDYFVNCYGSIIYGNDIVEYKEGFKSYNYFHKYPQEQIDSLGRLLLLLCNKWDIPKTYDEGIFKISSNAFKGVKGIYTHNSYRTDKTDIHPQPEMIEMLKNLNKY